MFAGWCGKKYLGLVVRTVCRAINL
jgi:hypothetical protein